MKRKIKTELPVMFEVTPAMLAIDKRNEAFTKRVGNLEALCYDFPVIFELTVKGMTEDDGDVLLELLDPSLCETWSGDMVVEITSLEAAKDVYTEYRNGRFSDGCVMEFPVALPVKQHKRRLASGSTITVNPHKRVKARGVGIEAAPERCYAEY